MACAEATVCTVVKPEFGRLVYQVWEKSWSRETVPSRGLARPRSIVLRMGRNCSKLDRQKSFCALFQVARSVSDWLLGPAFEGN